MEVDQADRVLLQLYECTVLDTRTPVAASTVCAKLNGTAQLVGDAGEGQPTAGATDQLSVRASLETLVSRGLVTEHETQTAIEAEPRYELTPDGQSQAASLRSRLTTEPVRVRIDDQYRELSIEESLGHLAEEDSTLPDDAGLAARLQAHAQPETGPLSIEAIEGIAPVGVIKTDAFVGREQEWSRLQETAAEARAGRPRTMIVGGPGGVGKTTLVSRYRNWAEDAGLRTALGTTRPDRSTAYQPFRSALSPVFDRTGIDDPFEAASGSTEIEQRSTAQKRQSGLYADVADALDRIAADRPLVVVLEDLHRAAPPTLALFQYLTTHLTSGVVLVATARTNELSTGHPLCQPETWATGERWSSLSLDPFDERTTRRLVREVLSDPAVPGQFVEALYERTDGNPLFVTKTVQALQERGAITVDDGAYPDPQDDLPYPAEVGDAITQRFSGLPETAWMLLGTAAVIASPIDTELLSAAVDVAPARVDRAVDRLDAAQVLTPISEGTLRFTSGVVEETVLDCLDDATLRRMHGNVAEAMVAGAANQAVAPARIAHHYERANRPKPALDEYVEAAERATRVYAYDAAVEYYESALGIARTLDRDEQVHDLLEALARVEFLAGDYERAIDHLETARRRTADRDRSCRLARHQTEMERIATNHEAALAVANDALEAWDGTTPSRAVGLLLGERALVHRAMGNPDAATDDSKRQLAIGEAIDDRRLVGHANVTIGLAAEYRGNHEAAVRRFQEAIELLEGTDDRMQLAKAYNNLGATRFRNDELVEAKESIERACERYLEVGDEVNTSLSRMNLGSVYVNLGELDAARETFEAALDSFRRFGQTASIAFTRGNLSEVLEHQGELTAAGAMARAALRSYERDGGISRYHASFLCQYADWVLRRDHPETAIDCARKALDIATEADSRATVLQARCVLARAHRVAGNTASATEVIESAFEEGSDLDNRRWHHTAYRERAAAELAAGRVESALENARTAREMAEETANPWQVIDAEETYGRCLQAVGRYEAAADAFERALAEATAVGGQPRIARIRFRLGALYRERGEERTAASSLEAAADAATEMGYHRIERLAREPLQAIDEAGS